jgi:hypothetical protein
MGEGQIVIACLKLDQLAKMDPGLRRDDSFRAHHV